MMYRFATERGDHTDLASGRVLQAVAGEPALPVRLTDEVFQRCLAALGTSAPLTLYDPCCGAAYHLTVLGFLHPQRIARILASEIQPALVEAARRNLSLLRPDGLDQRRAGLERLLAEHGKPSHREALGSLERLRQRLSAGIAGRGLTTDVFAADVTDPDAVAQGLGGARVDLVLTDVPYGWHSAWMGGAQGDSATAPLERLLTTLLGVLAPGGVVAIVSDKGQRATHPAYTRVERFQVGRRRVEILKVLG